MRNLQVFREEAVNARLEDSNEVVVAAAYDSDKGRLFLASSVCTIYILSFDGQDPASTSLLDDKLNGSSPAGLEDQDKIISMEFLSEKEVLVLGLAAGDILQFDPSAQEVEVVGAIEGGVVSMVLSPDGELLVVATGLGQLLLMTQDWDVLYEVSLNQPPVGFCPVDTLGWIFVIQIMFYQSSILWSLFHSLACQIACVACEYMTVLPSGLLMGCPLSIPDNPFWLMTFTCNVECREAAVWIIFVLAMCKLAGEEMENTSVH
jgi:hypothetical protein